MARKAAIIGCGSTKNTGKTGWAIGYAHANGYLAADPTIELYGVDPNAENAAAFGEKYGIPASRLFKSTAELYAAVTPDYVSIGTWPKLHAPQTIEAANAGVKGIICEKPMAVSPAEVKEMIDICAKKNVKLAINHQRRQYNGNQTIKKLLAEGAIGDGVTAEFRIPDDWDIMSWTVHWFDFCNYIFEATPEWVLAGMDITGERRYQHAVENASVILAQYPANRQAVFITGPANPQPYMVYFRGSKGMIQFPEGSVVRVINEKGLTIYGENDPAPADPMKCMAEQIINAVEKGEDMICSAANCAAATEIAFAAHESAKTAKKVYLPVKFTDAPLER